MLSNTLRGAGVPGHQIQLCQLEELIFTQKHLKNLKQLTEEDKEAVLFIQKKGEISRGEFAAEFDLNDKTAQRRLANLIERNLIVMIGDRKGAKYKTRS